MERRVMAKARTEKKDEFYTKLETIENELAHYKQHFKNKTVYCNCDDPRESMFFRYFLENFDNLKLKRIISSCYISQDYNLFNIEEMNEKAVWMDYSGEKVNGKIPTVNELEKKELIGDGDFRGQESIKLLKESDIVVTNPPFSLFKEYIQQLVDYDKKFIIIGNTNAVTYKDFFTLLKNNEIWAGTAFNKTIEFRLPTHYEDWDRVDPETGDKFGKVPAVSWWTNLEFAHRSKLKLTLKQTYIGNEDKYPRYCNYDAIDVSKISEIPLDYSGIMGVPITLIGKFNPKQFEILGLGAGEIYKELGGKIIGQEFLDRYLENGGKGNYVANQYVLAYYNKENKPVIPYMRILVKNKFAKD